MSNPICTIIAGPNGAGKTTFALRHLPEVAQCHNFLNADMIAAGLSPLNPEREKFTAGRLFLREVRRYIRQRESFAFETTLSGSAYLKMIRKLLTDEWSVKLYYLWLPDVETSISRVAERVAHGGHNIPEKDIRRRYPRSIKNLLIDYAPLCSETICVDNSSENGNFTIFTESQNEGRVVENKTLYQKLFRGEKI